MTIIKNELERNLGSFGGNSPHAELGNVAEVSAGGQGNGQGRNRVLMSPPHVPAPAPPGTVSPAK